MLGECNLEKVPAELVEKKRGGEKGSERGERKVWATIEKSTPGEETRERTGEEGREQDGRTGGRTGEIQESEGGGRRGFSEMALRFPTHPRLSVDCFYFFV